MNSALVWGPLGFLLLVGFCLAVILFGSRRTFPSVPPRPVRVAPEPADPAMWDDMVVAALEEIPLPSPWSVEARETLRWIARREVA